MILSMNCLEIAVFKQSTILFILSIYLFFYFYCNGTFYCSCKSLFIFSCNYNCDDIDEPKLIVVS